MFVLILNESKLRKLNTYVSANPEAAANFKPCHKHSYVQADNWIVGIGSPHLPVSE